MRRSETINEISAALAKAQGLLRPAIKDTVNPFFKSVYADLAAIIDVIREPMSSNGLAILQSIETDAGDVVITTLLSHTSGQWIETALRLKPTKNDPQGVASAATYGRRIGLQSLVGVAADTDDDGNAASATQSQKPAPYTKSNAQKYSEYQVQAAEPQKPDPAPKANSNELEELRQKMVIESEVMALGTAMGAVSDSAGMDAVRATFSKLSSKLTAEQRTALVALADAAKARIAVVPTDIASDGVPAKGELV
jgi:hypothetical protein